MPAADLIIIFAILIIAAVVIITALSRKFLKGKLMFKSIAAAKGLISGKKTYIVGAMVIAIGVIEGPLGMDIPGVDIGPDWVMYVMNGMGLGTLRAGIAKAAVGLG